MGKFVPPEIVEPELPRIYYAGYSQTYWIEDKTGAWMKINEGSVKRYLKKAGYSTVSEHGANSRVDEAFMEIQTSHNVCYTGGLAGYDRGPAEMNENKILITSQPRIIEPVAGEWPMLEGIFTRMFGDCDIYWYSWCMHAYKCLYDRRHRPGQIMILAGNPGSGKTFLQDVFLKTLLGGRSGHPYRYMTGGTDFNLDFFSTEHLHIGDECNGTGWAARQNFGKELKKVAAERTHSCHGKGVDAISMSPFWRCSISLNITGENLMILPTMESGLRDKMMLLRVHDGVMPMPTHTHEEEEEFRDAVYAEMPAFCDWLLGIEVPEGMRDSRYGMVAYQDPELVEMLDTHSPEEQTWDLIVYALTLEKKTFFEGTTQQLQETLTLASQDNARKLFYYASAIGVYLQRLADKDKGELRPRVQRPKTRNWWRCDLYDLVVGPAVEPEVEDWKTKSQRGKAAKKP